jgi:hypothetical protein
MMRKNAHVTESSGKYVLNSANLLAVNGERKEKFAQNVREKREGRKKGKDGHRHRHHDVLVFLK